MLWFCNLNTMILSLIQKGRSQSFQAYKEHQRSHCSSFSIGTRALLRQSPLGWCALVLNHPNLFMQAKCMIHSFHLTVLSAWKKKYNPVKTLKQSYPQGWLYNVAFQKGLDVRFCLCCFDDCSEWNQHEFFTLASSSWPQRYLPSGFLFPFLMLSQMRIS